MNFDLTAFSAALPPQFAPFLARLTGPGVTPGAPPATTEAPSAPAGTLTPGALRAALLQIGIAADPGNLLLAEAFSQLGIPLTPASFTEARVSLAQAPGAAPIAYALARSLGLPTTPDTLRALSVVTGGIPPGRALPAEVTERLSLAVSAQEDPDTVAARLVLMLSQRLGGTGQPGTGTAGNRTAPAPETRSRLLRVARSSGDRRILLGADTLAAHIEGQQLINLAAQRAGAHDQPPPLYFAFPLLLPGEQTMLEMSLVRRDPAPEDGRDEEEDMSWRTTIRLATSRLGRVEAELTGTAWGGLTCRLSAENPATARLLDRSRAKLAGALVSAGWPRCDVSCGAKTDWPPLWHGGQALTAPRTRIDREA